MVEIKTHHLTTWGKHLRLVGNCEALGSWDPCKSPMMSCRGAWDKWVVEVQLPSDANILYKFVLVDEDNTVHWESGEDHVNPTHTHTQSVCVWDTHKLHSFVVYVNIYCIYYCVIYFLCEKLVAGAT
eukprot:GHVR01107861.1.p1 GENE.GHVR01107861.1~~GHVR01107861.1.p1  ORF type:complete len:147 (+),score=50.79 GHVR01107861.1:61-441(+)